MKFIRKLSKILNYLPNFSVICDYHLNISDDFLKFSDNRRSLPKIHEGTLFTCRRGRRTIQASSLIATRDQWKTRPRYPCFRWSSDSISVKNSRSYYLTLVLVSHMSCCSCKEKGNILDKNDVQLSIESKSSLLWIGFVTRCDWLAKIAPVSRPMRGKAKTNRALLARFFSRFFLLGNLMCLLRDCREHWLTLVLILRHSNERQLKSLSS